MSNEKTALQRFFENQTCIVVETSKSFQASIQQCIKGLDLPTTTIILVSKYEEAVRRITELKPRFLITEYDVEGQNGLSLVELQQRFHDDQSRLSVVISRNSSDSVVAEAAEEQVDCFLLKPFSIENFRKKLLAAIETKTNPSPYSVKIREGRQAMLTKEYDKAKKAFNEAKGLHDKPSLACFYLGDAHRIQSEMSPALKEFQEGRSYQPLHYKCLTGEFEILVANKDYEKAHELIPTLVKHFPLTPQRLTQVFITTVFSMKFDLLLTYYEQLLKLDQRPPELIKVSSVALYTGGKWYLQNKDIKQACSLFEKALSIVNRNITMLEQIINELIKADAQQEAQTFFAKALPSDVGTSDYNRLSFKIDQMVLPRNELLEKARKLAFSGEASPENFKIIVKLFAEEDKVPLAESIINKAVTSYPELREVLYQILEQSRPAKEGVS